MDEVAPLFSSCKNLLTWILFFVSHCRWNCNGYHSADVYGSVDNSIHNLTATYREARLRAEANCLVNDPSTGKNKIKDHCTLFYVHVHKSGGSTICEIAKKQGYRTTDEPNCNLPLNLDTRLDSISYLKYIQDHRLKFVAQEKPPFNPSVTADNIIYFTTIRSPLDRLISQLHHQTCTQLESG